MSTEVQVMGIAPANTQSWQAFTDQLANGFQVMQAANDRFAMVVGEWMKQGHKQLAPKATFVQFCKNVANTLAETYSIQVSPETLRGWASVGGKPELVEQAKEHGWGVVASARKHGEPVEDTVTRVQMAVVESASRGLPMGMAARLLRQEPGFEKHGIPELRYSVVPNGEGKVVEVAALDDGGQEVCAHIATPDEGTVAGRGAALILRLLRLKGVS